MKIRGILVILVLFVKVTSRPELSNELRELNQLLDETEGT